MRNLLSILLLLIVISQLTYSQNKKYLASGEVSYLIPAGELMNRFKSTPGYGFFVGVQTSDKWTWGGKFEYFNYSTVNYNQLIVKSIVKIDGDDYLTESGLPDMKMNLKVLGLSLNAKYRLFQFSSLLLSADIGFGLYRWDFLREKYDSLISSVRTIKDSVVKVTLIKNAPSLSQNDWSGGFNFGISVDYFFTPDISLGGSVNYKNVLGELWAALAFNMENVSTMQMFSITGSLKVRF